MPRRERRESRSAVEGFEAEQAVLNERRIIIDPSFWPGPPKRVFESVIHKVGCNKAHTARQTDRLNARIRAVHQCPQRTPCQYEEQQRKKGDKRAVQPNKDGLVGDVLVHKESYRLIQ